MPGHDPTSRFNPCPFALRAPPGGRAETNYRRKCTMSTKRTRRRLTCGMSSADKRARRTA